MSADTHHAHDHGTMGQLMIGFALAAILTIIPFYLVMAEVDMARSTLVGIIMGLGAVQIIVHLVYFLHLKRSSEEGWNFFATIFAVIILVIVLVFFGAGKLPSVFRQLGSGMKAFKDAQKDDPSDSHLSSRDVTPAAPKLTTDAVTDAEEVGERIKE